MENRYLKALYQHAEGELSELIPAYIRYIETSPTTRANCTCMWHTHPDDVAKPEGLRRMRRSDVSMDCPSHTKEGFLLGFFKWAAEVETHETAG